MPDKSLKHSPPPLVFRLLALCAIMITRVSNLQPWGQPHAGHLYKNNNNIIQPLLVAVPVRIPTERRTESVFRAVRHGIQIGRGCG